MIRRWSCINHFNLYFNSNLLLSKRFNSLKLLKAVNYKKFVTAFTKFNRRKLAKWKRQSTWLIFTELFKFWIRDYNFFKRLAKSQFAETLFPHSIVIYDFFYIKKKNALRYSLFTDYIVSTQFKTFLTYYNKKYLHKNSLLFLPSLPNSNFVTHVSNSHSNSFKSEKLLNLLLKYENETYSANLDDKKKTINWFFYNLYLLQIAYSYKIFVFFFLIKR